MAAERKCRECGKGASANRKGKPGRCVPCIDGHYVKLGWNPCEPHVCTEHERRCLCTTCDQPDAIPYSEIRNKQVRYCNSCASRKMYEQGLVREPAKWDITKEEAARIVLGEEFLARDAAGAVVDESGLAQRMGHVWSLVEVECAVCGTAKRWSASMSLGSRAVPGRSRCSNCSALPLTAWQVKFFAAYGLVRDHVGYARLSERVEAHCTDCGAARRTSVSELASGVSPCLTCDAATTDPDASHLVYVVHFPRLGAYKVGITGTGVRHDRLASHAAQGGVPVGRRVVPNREAARTVEEFVLRVVRDHPSGCTAEDFPQGGFTETWAEDGPEVDLGGIVDRLAREEAPGFDRLGKVKAFFEDEPLTIEELVEFQRIETIETDGGEVHCVGLSEPLEQVLRKVRARRASGATGRSSGGSRVGQRRARVGRHGAADRGGPSGQRADPLDVADVAAGHPDLLADDTFVWIIEAVFKEDRCGAKPDSRSRQP